MAWHRSPHAYYRRSATKPCVVLLCVVADGCARRHGAQQVLDFSKKQLWCDGGKARKRIRLASGLADGRAEVGVRRKPG